MASVKVHLYTYRPNREGTYPVVFQIIQNREKSIVFSPYHVYRECFDESHSRVVDYRNKKIENKEEINRYLHEELEKLKTIVRVQEDHGRKYTAFDIIKLYKSNRDDMLVYVYMQKIIDGLKEAKRLSTLNSYQSTMNCLIRYLGDKEDLCFSDITPRFLNGFIDYLKGTGLKENSINFYCRILLQSIR